MKNFIYFFSIIILIPSCGESDSDPPMTDPELTESPDCSALDDKSLELVTGIRFFDENGSPIGQAGNPNITRESPLSIYPSPNNGVIYISKQNDLEYDLFIFPCEKDTMCSEVDFDNVVIDYSIDSLYNLDSTTLDVVTPDLQIQFHSDFEVGYYKLVFYRDGEDVIVENMYYDSSKSGNEMIDFLNSEF